MVKHQQMVEEVADPLHVPRAVVTEIPEQGVKVQHSASQPRWLIEGYATCLDQLAKHKHKFVLQHQRRHSAKADKQREPTFMVGGGLLRTWENSVELVHFCGSDAERYINEILASLMDTYLVLHWFPSFWTPWRGVRVSRVVSPHIWSPLMHVVSSLRVSHLQKGKACLFALCVRFYRPSNRPL